MATAPITALDVFKNTPRTNCGECGLPNCMAFSLQVLQGQKDPHDCPYIDADFAEGIAEAQPEEPVEEPDRRKSLIEELMQGIPRVDFALAAKRLDGSLRGDRLAVRCLGKIFEVDSEGGLHSDTHVHAWVHLPVLQYVVHAEGQNTTGAWKTFGELGGFGEWNNFFRHRCEKTLHKMADEDPDLFFDVLGLFGRAPGPNVPTADRAVLLHPLPKVPMLVLYWDCEGDFESKLTLLFDRATEANLGAEGTYLLVQGMVEMLRKITLRHARM